MELTYTQCKQLAANYDDLHAVVQNLQDQPEWIECGNLLDMADVQAVQQGGCASGAYMPAVTYHTANQTMGTHGDAVAQYIEDHLGEVPQMTTDESWGMYCCTLVSTAVELWCGQFNLDGVDWD